MGACFCSKLEVEDCGSVVLTNTLTKTVRKKQSCRIVNCGGKHSNIHCHCGDCLKVVFLAPSRQGVNMLLLYKCIMHVLTWPPQVIKSLWHMTTPTTSDHSPVLVFIYQEHHFPLIYHSLTLVIYTESQFPLSPSRSRPIWTSKFCQSTSPTASTYQWIFTCLPIFDAIHSLSCTCLVLNTYNSNVDDAMVLVHGNGSVK